MTHSITVFLFQWILIAGPLPGVLAWRPLPIKSTSTLSKRQDWFQLRGGASDGQSSSCPWESEGTLENYLGPVVRPPDVWATGPRKRGLILMDSFCPYFGAYMAHQARVAYGVCTVNVLSNYMKNFFAKEQPDDWKSWMPASMPADMAAWKNRLPCGEIVAVHCESDSGLADAELLAVAAQVTCCNIPDEARRNKFLMNEAVSKVGLAVVRQKLCSTFSETLEFATELLEQQKEQLTQQFTNGHFDAGLLGQGKNTFQLFDAEEEKKAHCIVKPTRGVASENVHLCSDIDSVKEACNDILTSAIFGDPSRKHEAVLVQEFAAGTEYAVDIVSKDGEHKIAALWRYDKRPANGAPFCYFATELIDATRSQIGASVCEYAKSCLTALGQKWGLSHTEVIVTQQGPRLVEVNCRQHNMDFTPLTMACIGYNAFDMLLAAYLGGQSPDSYPQETARLRLDWDTLPALPALRMHGAMVHLVSFAGGKLSETKLPHLDEIHNMESTLELEVYPEYMTLGAEISKTTDIRSDAGWVQILNEDPDAFKRDYDRIVQLMPQLFATEDGGQEAESKPEE